MSKNKKDPRYRFCRLYAADAARLEKYAASRFKALRGQGMKTITQKDTTTPVIADCARLVILEHDGAMTELEQCSKTIGLVLKALSAICWDMAILDTMVSTGKKELTKADEDAVTGKAYRLVVAAIKDYCTDENGEINPILEEKYQTALQNMADFEAAKLKSKTAVA